MKRPEELKSRCRFCGNLIRLSKLSVHKRKCYRLFISSEKPEQIREANKKKQEDAESTMKKQARWGLAQRVLNVPDYA